MIAYAQHKEKFTLMSLVSSFAVTYQIIISKWSAYAVNALESRFNTGNKNAA